MLALKREERYIVNQVSSDMNMTETRLRISIDSIPAMAWCCIGEVAFKRPNHTEQGVSSAIISSAVTRLLGLSNPIRALVDLFEPLLSNTTFISR